MKKPKKVLILGSGPLKIGQAGEFDYSGSQAIKALKEEGIKTILINPNIATIQTSEFLASEVYFLPVTDYFVEKVIKKERPDGIMLAFGGQTALNCGVALYRRGILKKYKVRVLGTNIESIILTEDRDKFAKHLAKIGVSTPKSYAVKTEKEAQVKAKIIGYPIMVRAAYALGGQNSGIVHNSHELKELCDQAFTFSPQVLIEQYLHHFKEIEYEVVRDAYDNCVTVCNMENMDPLGIHTGESIVVAPSQTLNNFEYHHLREISIKIIRSLGIVGECNVQFAPSPNPKGEIEYYVIEVNARLSRSSALASKATGYPLAYVAARLALGKNLVQVKNQITRVTQSCFEPALDYLVVKIPRWDLEKFRGVEERIGSSMKSVGEVMAIGRTFEEAIQKAMRMLDIGAEGVTDNNLPKPLNKLLQYLKIPTPKRPFAIASALRRNVSIKKIQRLTGIDPWFLHRIKNIVDAERNIETSSLEFNNLLQLKQLGVSDKRISILTGELPTYIRQLRKKLKVMPSFLQIDTLAGEFPAKTNYLYATYNAAHHDIKPLKKDGVVVLGSGPYRIGSSVEFDWTCVNCAMSLRRHSKKSIIINCNPETVSTDYDISDRLYFEELTHERVADIYEFEESLGVITSVGGQTPNNLALKLAASNIKILGTQAADIDRAEDRNKFSKLLDEMSILQPAWNTFTSQREMTAFIKRVDYPVLIRPSYVLSGMAMNVCYNDLELKKYLRQAQNVSKKYPLTVSKFITHSKEIELDGIAQNGKIMAYAISEHVENAGVHSGDASIIFPPENIYLRTEKRIVEIGNLLAEKLKITGPFNIQFISRENQVYVIEINLRASRTLPFISKASNVNLATLLTDSLFGRAKHIEIKYPNYQVVKVAQFSFSRLEGADPVLRVEMSSTGEAACFGRDTEEAFLKSELSVGEKIAERGIFLSLGGDENKIKFLDALLKMRHLKLPIYATEKTANFLNRNKIKTKRLFKIHENKTPNVLSAFQDGKIDLAINIVDTYLKKDINDDYVIRRQAVDHNIHIITNRRKAMLFINSLVKYKISDLEIKSWREYGHY